MEQSRIKRRYRAITDKFLRENIDEGMRYAIKHLNEKGYETAYCCEGHWEERYNCYFGAYIAFKEPLQRADFPRLPTFPWIADDKTWSKYKSPITQIGSGYKNKPSQKTEECFFYWIGTRYKRMSRADKDKEHEQFLKELNEWVDSLENKE